MLESINLQQDIQNDNMNYFISKFIHNKKPSKCTPLNLKFSLKKPLEDLFMFIEVQSNFYTSGFQCVSNVHQ